MSTTPMTLDEILESLLRERFQYVAERCASRTSDYEIVGSLQAQLSLGECSAHDALRELLRLASPWTLRDGIAQAALHLGVEACIAMRSQAQADAWIALCQGKDGIGEVACQLSTVEVLLAFDEREKAEKLLGTIEETPESALVRARYSYIKGDFADALALAGPLTERASFTATQARALRLAAQASAADRSFANEAMYLERILAEFPDGAHSESERLDLATAFAAQGTTEAFASAEEQLRILADGDPEASIVRYAKKRLEYLETATSSASEGAAQHAWLTFPTVHQKRNYCGPAVLELCLRSLGIELGQDEIAGVVKRENGTPMFEIVAFLEEREIEARRVVANLDRLRAAIDLGLPVIIQEEYSTTCHVAVVTGYDNRLGLFVCQDPMTHRAQHKSYEWVQNSGQLFGNGVVVVVGRRSELSEELAAKLEAAELVAHPAFAILDEADRMRASAHGEGQEKAVVHEVLSACQRALDADPDYQLAWHRRAWAELRRYRGDRNYRPNAQRSVHMARVTWRGAEWPHQLHASMLEQEGRYREAYVEHLSAHRCDPSDGENLAAMSHCLGRLGDIADGVKYGAQALRVLPSHPWIAAELAVQYTQALGARDEGAWSDAKELPGLAIAQERPCNQPLELDTDELHNCLQFYTMLAREQQGENLTVLSLWCQQAALAGDFGEACARYEEALKLHENEATLLTRLARAAMLAGDTEKAEAAAELLIKEHASEVGTWLGAAEVAKADAQEAWNLLQRGLQEVGPDRNEMVDALWSAGRTLGGGNEAAAVLLVEASEKFANDARFVRLIADCVDNGGQRGLAVQLYRRVVESEEGDLSCRYRLGTLLSDDPLTRDEGRERLAEVLKMAPSATVARVRLAWCLMEDPLQGLDVLAPAMDEGNSRVYETACALLRANGQEAEADRMRAMALGAFASEDDARAELGPWHYYSDRYDLAVELLEPLTKRDFAGTSDVEEVQDSILTAYRLGGRVAEIQDWVRELCKTGVPKHLAFEVYWAFRSVEHGLAAAAARVQAEHADSPSAALEFETNAASCDARAGDTKALDALVTRLEAGTGLEVESEVEAWETVYHALSRLKNISGAENALQHMRKLKPEHRATLVTEENFASLQGRAEDAFAAAHKIRELYPYQHMGDERLGILYGTAGDGENALAHASRALSIAPYCHISHASGAMAYFAAGDIERARVHMERAESLDVTETPLQWSASTALMHALRGDREQFEACVLDRSRTIEKYSYPKFEERLREVLEAAAST
tara:strand:+ start:24994 stop:28779 length:3786 start_codon:yes stop_codon:yes gene_type:complete